MFYINSKARCTCKQHIFYRLLLLVESSGVTARRTADTLDEREEEDPLKEVISLSMIVCFRFARYISGTHDWGSDLLNWSLYHGGG